MCEGIRNAVEGSRIRSNVNREKRKENFAKKKVRPTF